MAENKSSSTDSPSSSQTRNPCPICLDEMTPGAGHALFTAECSHTFHFQCISLNAQHGDLTCPLCKTQWRQLPFQPPVPPPPSSWSFFGSQRPQHQQPQHPATDTESYNDDEPLESQPADENAARQDAPTGIDLRSYTEYRSLARQETREINILIHLQAPTLVATSDTARAPLDLVAVVDVSYSMLGEKLALLKQAMNFVVRCLHPSDRLSIVSFSNVARRQLPLRLMSPTGKADASEAVAALQVVSNTNIADGITKGARVMEERRQRNPVSGMLFLSDGQDNCSFLSRGPENVSRLPPSITGSGGASRVPIHAFGFGSDHDAALMSSIAEASGGTFSFVEAENSIQDAFAQCLGGLMSVAVQGVRVGIECASPGVQIVGAIRSGTYPSHVDENRRAGSIDVGDLYAGETRDFILRVSVPQDLASANVTKLLYLKTVHTEPVSKRVVESTETGVKIARPIELNDDDRVPCPEVDRQRRRYEAWEAMEAAHATADRGQYTEAVTLLQDCRTRLFDGHNDELSMLMSNEIGEMQGRLGSRVSYEHHGRAYMLAGISSHRQQRATSRSMMPAKNTATASLAGLPNSDNGGLVTSPYQTAVMAQMLVQSRSSTTSGAPQ